MPQAIKKNRPTKILRIIIPPRNGHIVHHSGLRTADLIRARTAYEFGQDTPGKPAPLYLLGSKVVLTDNSSSLNRLQLNDAQKSEFHTGPKDCGLCDESWENPMGYSVDRKIEWPAESVE
jgi:hypothetical protein